MIKWWYGTKLSLFVTYPAVILTAAVFYMLIGPRWSNAINFGLMSLLLALAVAFYLLAKREFDKAEQQEAAGSAHKAAGELAYERAMWANVHGSHSHYTVADDAPAVAGLIAIKCCGCDKMVGVAEGNHEVTELAHRHIKEEFALLRKSTETQVPG